MKHVEQKMNKVGRVYNIITRLTLFFFLFQLLGNLSYSVESKTAQAVLIRHQTENSHRP